MATVTKTVKQSGGDYSSLESCLNANEQNLVTAGDTFVASLEGTWSVDDTTSVLIDGWTCDADNYIRIETDADARHDGAWSTTAHRLVPSSTRCIACKEPYTEIVGLQMDNSAGDSRAVWLLEGPNGVVISHCIIKSDEGENGIEVSSLSGASTIYIYNNILYDLGTRGILINDANATAYVYNNTIDGTSSVGIYAQAGTTVAKNNLAANCSSYSYYGTFDGNSDYNVSDDGEDTGGAHDESSQTFTFAGAADYHLDSADAGAQGYGTDLSSDGSLAFEDDIDGDTRDTPWDCGADQVAAAGSTETSTKSATGHVRSTDTDTATATGHVRTSATDTASATGHVKVAAQTDSATATGHVRSAQTDSSTATGHVKRTGETSSATATGHVGTGTQTSTKSATGHIKAAGETSTVSATGAVAKVETDTVTATGHVLASSSDGITATGHVASATQTATATATGHVLSSATDSVSATGAVSVVDSATKTATGHMLAPATSTVSATGYVTGGVSLTAIVEDAITAVYNLLNGDTAALGDTGGIVETAVSKTFTLLDGAL